MVCKLVLLTVATVVWAAAALVPAMAATYPVSRCGPWHYNKDCPTSEDAVLFCSKWGYCGDYVDQQEMGYYLSEEDACTSNADCKRDHSICDIYEARCAILVSGVSTGNSSEPSRPTIRINSNSSSTHDHNSGTKSSANMLSGITGTFLGALMLFI